MAVSVVAPRIPLLAHVRDCKALRFCVWFGVLSGAFALVCYPWLIESQLFQTYLTWNAELVALVLRALGEDVVAVADAVVSPRFRVRIAQGCDSLFPSGMFAAAVLAFPVDWRRKWCGLALGVVAVFAINLVRIVTLYEVGTHWPNRFATIHIDVWRPVFFVLSVAVWMVWAWWATRLVQRVSATFKPTSSGANSETSESHRMQPNNGTALAVAPS